MLLKVGEEHCMSRLIRSLLHWLYQNHWTVA
jgi:hypothetical protein